MRHLCHGLMIAGLIFASACIGGESRLAQYDGSHTEAEEGETAEEHDGHDHSVEALHGEVHDFNFAATRDAQSSDFEAGAEMQTQVIRPDKPFRGVKMMLTARRLDLEYRFVLSNGETNDWMPLTPAQSNGKFHNAYIGLQQSAIAFHFRSTSPLDYARFEFFEQPVETADAHDDAQMYEDEDVRRQALAHAGRYTPPADVREAGRAHRGNFSYQPAPAWNGGRNCSGSFLPGARALGDFLVENFEGAAYYQGYNCRQIRGSSGMSMHGTGRAIDVFIPRDESQPYNNQADNDLGDPVANYLIENATELGVQFFIWDQAKWSISYVEDRSYGGAHPHHDHLHIELTTEAAHGGGSFPGASSQPQTPFSDDDDSTHEEAINALYDEGITSGCGDDSYCPQRGASRANTATVLMRAFGVSRDDEDRFSDDDGMNSEAAINAVAAHGLMIGCNDGARLFCPEEGLTRGAFAAILDRALGLDDTADHFFSDVSAGDYTGAINRLAAAGIAEGCAQSQFCPDDMLTRGQLATFLARALGLVDRVAIPGTVDRPQPDDEVQTDKPVEIVLRWQSDQVDLDLRMTAPDTIIYQDIAPNEQGWLHGGDTCPSQFGPGCIDQPEDGGFTERIMLEEGSSVSAGASYAFEVETFDGEGAGASFTLEIYKDGRQVRSFDGQAAALGEAQSFEFSFP